MCGSYNATSCQQLLIASGRTHKYAHIDIRTKSILRNQALKIYIYITSLESSIIAQDGTSGGTVGCDGDNT